MELMVNGKKEILADSITIKDFLMSKNMDPEKVVVELNMDIIDRKAIDDVMLKENDALEVLRFVGGG